MYGYRMRRYVYRDHPEDVAQYDQDERSCGDVYHRGYNGILVLLKLS